MTKNSPLTVDSAGTPMFGGSDDGKSSVNGVDTKSFDSNLVPSIRDEKGGWDIFSKLLDDRVIRLDGQVDDGMAAIFVSALHILEARDPDADITVMINSPGGSVIAGLAMYDAMRDVKCKVKTVVSGMAASMGSILLCAGDERYATKNARVMIHQPSGGGRGTATDTRTNQDLIEEMWDDLTQIYVDHSGTPHEVFDQLLRMGDIWLKPDQAKDLGLIDGVVKFKKPEPKTAGMKRSEARKHFNQEKGDVISLGKEARKQNLAQLDVSNDDKAAAPAAPAAKTPKQGG